MNISTAKTKIHWFASVAILLAVSALVAGAKSGEGEDEVKLVRRESLANVPGKTLTALTVHYAPGGRSAEHHHAGSVFAYVLSGAIRSECSATGPVQIYKAGESFFEPPGSKHLVSENASATEPASLLAIFIADDGAQLTTFETVRSGSATDQDLAHQILETMLQVPGNKAGYRTVHAKGIVCQGTFAPSREAATLSRAAHFQGASVPVTVRLSDGAPDPAIPDNAPNAGPRGMAIRFRLPGDEETDIVAMSHNGFVVGTGEEFLALQRAVVATDPGKPHPWPVEVFLGAHPRAMKFVQENRVVPASFATEAFFSNNAFLFVNKEGRKQAGRYQILPVAGQRDLSEAEAKTKPANFLIDDLISRLATAPIQYRLVVQLPDAGDSTNDASLVWPDDRKTVLLGTINITSAMADSAVAEKALAFDPTNLTAGISLSDDPLPALRSRVYALAVKYRRQVDHP